jgi:hypothetical protein
MLEPADLAKQSYVLKEEQLARESEKIREIELRIQKEINEKRLELSMREQELREMEMRIARERSAMSETPPPPDDAASTADEGARPSSLQGPAVAGGAAAFAHDARHSSIDEPITASSPSPRLPPLSPKRLLSVNLSDVAITASSPSPRLPPLSPKRLQSVNLSDAPPLAPLKHSETADSIPGGFSVVKQEDSR